MICLLTPPSFFSPPNLRRATKVRLYRQVMSALYCIYILVWSFCIIHSVISTLHLYWTTLWFCSLQSVEGIFINESSAFGIYTLESGVRKKLRCHVTISWRTFALLLFVLYSIRPFEMVHLQTCCITQTSSLSNTLWYHLTIVWHLHHSLLLSIDQQRVFIAKAHTLFNFHISVFFATWMWKALTSIGKVTKYRITWIGNTESYVTISA